AAGFGRFGAFRGLEREEQAEMIALNVRALTEITHLALPYMRKGAEIYNLCSLSSFQPVPYMAVYGATKSYVLSFTRALNTELRRDGIRAIAVSPGWVRTEFFDRAATDDTITYYNRYYDADAVVHRAIRDMARGKDVSVMGLPVRNQVRLVKLLPHRLVMKIWCRQQKK
ncbi:MAG: SDR family NAD(P)-dependent oxidoreductase, partial [Oscillospiraceae bacterium]|nr:SDR family NAD(P)-dependent oxidoreductase [Oscillospiraceae bacterium]